MQETRGVARAFGTWKHYVQALRSAATAAASYLDSRPFALAATAVAVEAAQMEFHRLEVLKYQRGELADEPPPYQNPARPTIAAVTGAWADVATAWIASAPPAMLATQGLAQPPNLAGAELSEDYE
eukprot:SAG22_NODE_12294_length_448_cov_0.936963_1_plen_126_part_00